MDLLDQLHRHVQDRPDHLAIRECAGGRTFTYGNLARAVCKFAARIHELIPQPSTLLLRCCNRAEFQIAFLGGLSAGHAIFPVATDITDVELLQCADRCGAIGIIDPELQVSLYPKRASVVHEPALLLQSSGTTGLPKIVCRPAETLDASATQIVQAISLASEDQILMSVPLSHSYGIEHGLLAPIYAGATVHLANGFDIQLIGRELSNSPITVFPAVPSVFEMLGSFSDLPEKFPNLRLAYSAGAPLPDSVNHAFANRFGLPIGQLYGATEFASITFADPAADDFDIRSVGKPMRGVDLKIDADDQLLVRAPSQMRGYIDAPTPFTPDGFFPTGDLARIDEQNRLTLTGRLKLLIDIGGRKVNPLEIEQVLLQHPGIAECVVVSIAQSQTVRRLKAIFTPVNSLDTPSADQLRHFLKDRLTPYKIPRVFEVRRTLPKSPAGKILRQRLETP